MGVPGVLEPRGLIPDSRDPDFRDPRGPFGIIDTKYNQKEGF